MSAATAANDTSLEKRYVERNALEADEAAVLTVDGSTEPALDHVERAHQLLVGNDRRGVRYATKVLAALMQVMRQQRRAALSR